MSHGVQIVFAAKSLTAEASPMEFNKFKCSSIVVETKLRPKLLNPKIPADLSERRGPPCSLRDLPLCWSLKALALVALRYLLTSSWLLPGCLYLFFFWGGERGHSNISASLSEGLSAYLVKEIHFTDVLCVTAEMEKAY